MCQVSELVMPVMTGGIDLYTGWHILLGNGPWDARVASPPFSWVALAAATAQAGLAGPSQHRKVQHSTSQTHITMASSCKQPMEAPQGCFCLWVGIYKLLKSRWNRGWAECRKDEKQFCAKPCVRTCPSRKCPDPHLRLVLVRNQRTVILPLLPQVVIVGSLLGQTKFWCPVKESP